MGQTRERIDLVHELRQLRSSEELLDRCHNGANVDQGLRRDRLDVLGRHALTDDALHTAETDPNLVLDQFTDGTDTTVGEVVLIVEAVTRLLLDEVEHVRDRGEYFDPAEHVLTLFRHVEQRLAECVGCADQAELLADLGDFGTELAVQLVTANSAQVVATVLEERVAEVSTRRLDGRRLPRTGTLVNLDERFVLGRSDVAFLVPLTFKEVELGNKPLKEAGSVLLIEPEGAQQSEHTKPTLASDAGSTRDILARTVLDVELHPLTAVRVDRSLDQLVLGEITEAVTLTWLKDHARATDELGHDNALGAVDDKRALLGHCRQVAHEHGLLFDFARVAVHEASAHEDRRAVRHIFLFALLDRELGRRAQILVERIELEFELEGFREVLDRADVAERVR